MMASGSWQVRFTVNGQQGSGTLAVPIPSVALTTRKMQAGLGVLLSCLATFLVLGLVMIVGAAVRESKLPPGEDPSLNQIRRGQIAMAIAFVIILAIVWFGNRWWTSDAKDYGDRVYKPLQMAALVDSSGVLTLKLRDPGWILKPKSILRNAVSIRRIDDFVLDHNHLMHLYAIREPGMDVVYHLHPELTETATFSEKLPSIQPGTYHLYADVVHADGFPETMVATVNIPTLPRRPLTGDDAGATAVPWQQASTSSTAFALPDGYTMQWLRDPAPLRAKEPIAFRFRLIDAQGRAPNDMELYMGMLGHAAFVKTDGTAFAHIHPTGSVAMAAFMMAQKGTPDATTDQPPMDMNSMEMKDMDMSTGKLPNEVTFPYGFPSPGRYRILVQMKHGGRVETGVFDAIVS
jgi:hypothetical protein